MHSTLARPSTVVRVCLGGTFHPFHVGHEALLRRAFNAELVFIGITTGDLAKRDRSVLGIEDRAAAITAFAASCGFAGALEIRPLEDAVGPAASGAYDAIVVSPETRRGAERINELRVGQGLEELEIWQVPHVLADDRLPISATAIAAGIIDRNGRRLAPVSVVVGSANPVKVEGVRQAFERFVQAEVRGCRVDSGVPEQPKGDETLAGARARAVAAMAAEPSDYAVGVEAGLNQDGEGTWYDVQAVVVLDRTGRETTGYGPAFCYPESVRDRALEGEMISDILAPVAGDGIGGTTGAIGWMTDGALDRTALTRVGVLAALAPRWKPELLEPTTN